MPIQIICTKCQTQFSVSDKFAGKKGPCPKCRQPITVPRAEAVSTHKPTQERAVAVNPVKNETAADEVGGIILLGVLWILAFVPPLFIGPWWDPLLPVTAYWKFSATGYWILHNICFWGGLLAAILSAWGLLEDAGRFATGKPVNLLFTVSMLPFLLLMSLYPICYWNISSKQASSASSEHATDLSRPAAGTWAGMFGLAVNPTPETYKRFVEHEIRRIREVAPALQPAADYRLDLRKTDSVISPYEGSFIVECQSEYSKEDVGIRFPYTVACRYGLIDGKWTCQDLTVTEEEPIPFSKRVNEPINSPASQRALARVRAIEVSLNKTKAKRAGHKLTFQSIDELSRGEWGADVGALLLSLR